MKKLIASLALVGLAVLAFGQDAPKAADPAPAAAPAPAPAAPAPAAKAAPTANSLGQIIKDPVLTIGGTLESGVASVYNGVDAADVYLRGDRQNGGAGGRLDINSKVDLGDAGASFQLRADNWNVLAAIRKIVYRATVTHSP